jgi:hypothetical protein
MNKNVIDSKLGYLKADKGVEVLHQTVPRVARYKFRATVTNKIPSIIASADTYDVLRSRFFNQTNASHQGFSHPFLRFP